MRHELKTWPEFYRAVQDNKKTFELRYDDRRYAVGDELLLREFQPCHYCIGTGKVAGTRWIQDNRTPYMSVPIACENKCKECDGSGGRYTSHSMLYKVTYILRDHPGIRSGYVIMGLYSLYSGDPFV